MQSFVAFVSQPSPTAMEMLAAPGVFLLVLLLTMLAGLPWHAGLATTGAIVAFWLFGFAAKSGGLSPETAIGAMVAAMLLVAFWKLKGKKAQP